VAVLDGDAIAVRAEPGVEHLDAAAIELAEQLDDFFLQLFFPFLM
jgi:hypothetical protein